MPIFQLYDELIFPPPELAESDGLLAVGGDLKRERLLLAYSTGIFPWYSERSPILWWSPDPRLVLIPQELRVSRSLKQLISRDEFDVTVNTAFGDVIRACAEVHRNRDGGTWITDDMVDAYIDLHESGFAHSVESWYRGHLAGGLYGVSIGKVYFGESMFTLRDNASKVALVKLVKKLQAWEFDMIDCQIRTRHLISLGAREMPRSDYIRKLKEAVRSVSVNNRWSGIRGKKL